MYYFIASLFTWLFFFLSSLILFPILAVIRLVTYLFDRRKLRWAHAFTSFWGASFTWINPLWKVKISGREKIRKGSTYVIVSNHQSLLDILVLYRLFFHYKWVAKAELFKVPIVGWTMKLNNYIPVDRGNRTSHLKMMKDCENNLHKGNSVMIFPEGTRSANGEIQNFKDGAFRLALDTHTGILPVVLTGTAESLPKNGLFFKKLQTIRIKILDPLPYESFAHMSLKELALYVKQMMTESYEEMKKQ